MPILYPPGRSYGAMFHLNVNSVPIVTAFQLGWNVLPGAGASLGTAQDLVGTGKWGWSNATTYNLTGLNGLPYLQGDGATTAMVNTGVALAAPGTSPIFCWGVCRLDAWVTGRAIFAGAGAQGSCVLFSSGVTPQVRNNNAVSGPLVNMTLGQWFRVEAYYSNSTNDYLKIGPTVVTGVICGNNPCVSGASRGFQVMGGNTSFSQSSISAFFIAQGALPTVAERTALDSMVTSVYSGVVSV